MMIIDKLLPRKDKVEPEAAASPPTLAVTPEPEWVGWRLATFALDTIEPVPGKKTTATAIWRAYLDWCRAGKRVPLAMPVFATRFDDLADEVGIVRWQNGAHVLYRDLALKKA
jgi:hypothetical protein